MIEIRPITPEDAAAVSRLLQQLGYAAEPLRAAERICQLDATGSDPILLADADEQALGVLAMHLSDMLHYGRPGIRVTALIADPPPHLPRFTTPLPPHT